MSSFSEHLGEVMISMLVFSTMGCTFDPISCQTIYFKNWNLLLLCPVRITKETEQRLVGSELR